MMEEIIEYVQKLHLQPNDLLCIKVDANEDVGAMDTVAEYLKEYPFYVGCIFMTKDCSVEQISESQMNQLGWYRK